MNNQSKKSTEKSYNRLAHNYEIRWRKYLSHTHEIFLSHLHTGNDDIIIDLSCGTGMLASHLVDRQFNFNRLVLNDISEEMLSIAKQRLKENAGIEFFSRNVSELPFKKHTFTKILCLNAFHNYPDQNAAIRECYRILKPGGQIFILDWNNSGFFKPVNFIISYSTSEIINTLSLQEAAQTFKDHSFSVSDDREWYWRYWKFFRFKAIK